MRFDTRVVRGGIEPESVTGAIVPPLFQSATFVLEEVGKDKGFDYTRSSNPTRLQAEKALASVEGAEHCAMFSSGMAAVDAVVRTLPEGAHVVCSDDVYGGVSRLYNTLLSRHGYSFTYVDTSYPERVAEAIRPETKLVWIETPTNPLLKVTDVQAVADISHQHGIPLGVDSTFSTPALLRPLEWGADIVMHSTTKYISGHNQLIGGAVLTNDDAFQESMRYQQKCIGAIPSPFDSWLTLLGLKTLSLRMDRHSSNAMIIARFLEDHPKVARVSYPGLESHPRYAVAASQMASFGGMISFELDGGLDAGRTLMNNVKLCALAESLGAVESMITHPATMTHADVPRDERVARGLTDGLVRLSVGIEDPQDILDDLSRALELA